MKVLRNISSVTADYIKSVDKWILLLCALLSGGSIFFLYGIYYVGYIDSSRVKTQIVAVVIGLAVAIFLSFFNYHTLIKFWKIYTPIWVIAVILTYIMGVSRGSNQAWLQFSLFSHTISIQPAEFLKISMIVTFSMHLNHVKNALNKLENFLLLTLHAVGYVVLIVIQRDDGTAIVMFGIFAVMFIIAGLSIIYIALGSAAIFEAVPLLWLYVMSPDQQMRFKVLADPSISERYAYQQLKGLQALALGGMTGVGINNDVYVYVPESYNDFLFTFIGQVTGLIGCLVVMLLITALCIRLVYKGNRAPDITGRMICMGLMAMVLVQSVMNIGMCINVLPVIGVPLPFLSSGGSSIVAIYIGVGLVLSVCRHSKQDMFA